MYKKKISSIIFFQFLVIKTPGPGLDPDPDWIWISIQSKMLDPDPYQINADPQPCRVAQYGTCFAVAMAKVPRLT
jgi:hypothetical protein